MCPPHRWELCCWAGETLPPRALLNESAQPLTREPNAVGAFPSLSAHSRHPKTHCPPRAGAPFPAPALPLLTLQPCFWSRPASHPGGGCNGDTCGLESQILAPPSSSCVVWCQFLNFSVSHFLICKVEEITDRQHRVTVRDCGHTAAGVGECLVDVGLVTLTHNPHSSAALPSPNVRCPARPSQSAPSLSQRPQQSHGGRDPGGGSLAAPRC